MSTQALRAPVANDEWVPTACGMCYLHCPIIVHRIDGVAVKIEGNPTSPGTRGGACPKGNAGIMRLYDPKRVKAPLKRTNPEKGLGADPGWVEISWDEAMATLIDRLRHIRATDPRRLAVGGFNPDSWMWNWAFAFAFGTPNGGVPNMFSAMGHMCGPGPHLAGLMTHGSENTHPDVEFAEYILIVGGSVGEAYQSAVPYGHLFGDARERSCRIVVVDPQQSRAAAMADEWVPIRPATDGALLFAMMHTLVHELGIIDTEYLKTYTNAAYLIGDDGYPLRDAASGKPLVWDVAATDARCHDDPDVADCALEGRYETPAGSGRPAFDIFAEQLRRYTPEWAAEITSVGAATIRRLAKELGTAARIGATITLDGVSHPHRPASVCGYRGIGAHSNGFHASWAMETINLLIGATRAVGGARAWHGEIMPWKDGILSCGMAGSNVPMTWPPDSVSLHEYFPTTCTNGLLHFDAQAHPEKYKVTPVDTVIMECSNPLMTGQNPGLVIEGLKKIPFLVDITTYIDETAQFADLILPDTVYLERWEIAGSAHGAIWSVEDEGVLIQRPVVEPAPGVRQSSDVFLELGQALDIVTGPAGMSAFMCGVFGPAFDLDKPYRRVRDYAEDYVEHMGAENRDVIWKQGHLQHRVPPAKRYLPDCLEGLRLPFYNLWFQAKGDAVRKLVDENRVFEQTSLDERIFFEYAPLPFWHPSVVDQEPKEFDLYAINWKTALSTAGAGTVPASNAWLMEIVERDPYVGKILINRRTAEAKGFREGDAVCVESRYGRMQGRLKLTETIHPEVIGTIGCLGHYAGQSAEKAPWPHFNVLLGSGYEYGSPTTLQAETVARVKISHASSDWRQAAG